MKDNFLDSFKISIIYEDDNLIVVNKPPGIITCIYGNQPKQINLKDLVTAYLKKGDDNREAFVVHRLDKETSGVIIFCKNSESMFKISKQFMERKVDKKYVACVIGSFKMPVFKENTKKSLNLWVEGYKFGCFIRRGKKDRRKFVVAPDGKWALSEFYPKFIGENYSLVYIKPFTGRIHQIRSQLKFFGYPIAGDMLYCNKKDIENWNDFCRKIKIKPRMMLHALSIKIQIPTGEIKKFFAPLPNEFRIIKNFICKNEEKKVFERKI